jgi:hypothetical protein
LAHTRFASGIMHVYGLDEWSMSIQAPPLFWHAFLAHVSPQLAVQLFVHRRCVCVVHADGQPVFDLGDTWYWVDEHVRRAEQARLRVLCGAVVWYVLVPQVVSAVHTRLRVAVGDVDS